MPAGTDHAFGFAPEALFRSGYRELLLPVNDSIVPDISRIDGNEIVAIGCGFVVRVQVGFLVTVRGKQRRMNITKRDIVSMQRPTERERQRGSASLSELDRGS